jgi:CheY-like chemotaxis protein
VQLTSVIVDDDEDFLEAAQALLERDGVTVAGVAHNSAEAVQRTQALRPDVVLIDIRLGRESGFETVRQLADNGHPAALVMISTHAGEDYAELIAESPVLPAIRLLLSPVPRTAPVRHWMARSGLCRGTSVPTRALMTCSRTTHPAPGARPV